MEKNIFETAIFIFLIIFLGFFLEAKSYFFPKNEIIFFDLQNGESTLIKTRDNKKILIDGGGNKEILSKLGENLNFFENKIDLLIISHFDSDHFFGAIEIAKRYEIGEVWLNQKGFESPAFKDFQKIINDKKINYVFLNQFYDVQVGSEIFIDNLFPFETIENTEKTNNFAIVSKIFIGKNQKSILFTGDIEKETEFLLSKNIGNLKSDILKSPHHGSKSSSSSFFLDLVKPNLVLIGANKGNKFGHPSKEILERYEKKGFNYKITGKIGDIVLNLD